MKWKIKNIRFDATDLKIDIEFEPKNNVLRYALAQIKIINYPEFISLQSYSKNYYEENVGVSHYSEIDWEEKLWAKEIKGTELGKNEVFIVHHIGETVIEKKLFDEILYDYGTKLLEIYQFDSELDDKWKLEMKKNFIN